MDALGDAIIKNSFIESLRRWYPDAHICTLISDDSASGAVAVLRDHSFSDELLMYPAGGLGASLAWLQLVRKLRSRRFDISVSSQVERIWPITPLLLHFCRIHSQFGPHHPLSPENFLLAERVRMTKPHWRDHINDLAVALGTAPVPRFSPAFPYERRISNTLESNAPALCVHVGGDRKWVRQWSLNNYCQLVYEIVKDFGVTIFLIGGAEETSDNEEIERFVTKRLPEADIRNLSGMNLNDVANAVATAIGLVGNDSAFQHLAAALETPTMIVYGPTDPQVWSPSVFDDRHRIVSKGLDCQPCDRFRRLTGVECHRGEDQRHACLTELTVSEVWSRVAVWLRDIQEDRGATECRSAPNVQVVAPIAAAELLDKISILEIKQGKITDGRKLKNVNHELGELLCVRDELLVMSSDLLSFIDQLKFVNRELWELEQQIRFEGAQQEFGDRFVSLARMIYQKNDIRAALKRQINEATMSSIVEEKYFDSKVS